MYIVTQHYAQLAIEVASIQYLLDKFAGLSVSAEECKSQTDESRSAQGRDSSVEFMSQLQEHIFCWKHTTLMRINALREPIRGLSRDVAAALGTTVVSLLSDANQLPIWSLCVFTCSSSRVATPTPTMMTAKVLIC